MQLIQFRIRSHQALNDSHWLSVKKGLNLLAIDDLSRASAILEFLATINPHSTAQLNALDSQAALYNRRGGYLRRVIPPKKTAALAVFTAAPQLITQLADLDEDLFETDRIEVGRRLDHSRWMNFVEISSSTRWKELKPIMKRLLQELKSPVSAGSLQALSELTTSLQDSDRLRRSLDTKLLTRLHELKPAIPPHLQDDYELACSLAGRAGRFLQAKQQVFDALPSFIHLYLNSDKHHDKMDRRFTSIQEALNLLTGHYRTSPPPVLLLNCSRMGRDDFPLLVDHLKQFPRLTTIIAAEQAQQALLPDADRITFPSQDARQSRSPKSL